VPKAGVEIARRAAGRLALAGFAAAALTLASLSGSASALVLKLPNGHRLSVQPLRSSPPRALATAGTAKLEYHGGPIMPSNTNYAFYWDPPGGPSYPAAYQSGLNTFFEDLAHDSGGVQNVDSVATQYNDSAGEFANYDSHFGGAILDTDPYPANGCLAAPICLTDAQLQAELKSYIKAHGLPHDLTHEYFLLTPPGVEDCFEVSSVECSAGSTSAVYCAYHGFINVSGGPIVYANDPYVTGNGGCDDGEHPNNNPSDGALQGGLSHEHNESITDPELNAWYASNGEENGDKCRTFNEATEFGTPLGTAPDGSRYNQVIDANLYWYQQEWSNEGLQCKQRLGSTASAPTVTKVVPKTGPTTGGTSVTITGTGFAGATAVKFGSTSATKFTVNSATSITATSPAAAPGLVDVTVTTPAGTSAVSLKDHFKITPLVTSVSPSSGPGAGGTTVTITGNGFALGAGATVIKFGTTASKSVNCSSSEHCTAVSPPHEAATVDVTARVNKVPSPKTGADQFKFV
jgi:IPT/TIG domain